MPPLHRLSDALVRFRLPATCPPRTSGAYTNISKMRRTVVSKIGYGDYSQFSTEHLTYISIGSGCSRRARPVSPSTPTPPPLRLPFLLPHPPSLFRYALSAPSVALLSGVRVCHLEVSSIPGFVSLVNQRVNETGFSYLHNLGS